MFQDVFTSKAFSVITTFRTQIKSRFVFGQKAEVIKRYFSFYSFKLLCSFTQRVTFAPISLFLENNQTDIYLNIENQLRTG